MKINTDIYKTYQSLPNKMYSILEPKNNEFKNVELFNEELRLRLGLPKIDSNLINVLLGNETVNDIEFIAQAYSGHQFGHFTTLGDGRALLIGEFGKEKLDIQLKGSGITPYSRSGDGLATLGAMIREYVMSEAMHGLKIPTTRILSVISTKTHVRRETYKQGAIASRVAMSHVRVGTFEHAVRVLDKFEFKQFTDYVMNRHFNYLEDEDYIGFLSEVIKKQAKLIAKWQSVGFIHGVMNTDNMTISGETIDYGPCAFMDSYDELTVFSSIDSKGRYAYVNQPQIAAWDLSRFAETLIGLLHDNVDEAIKIATKEIEKFSDIFNEEYIDILCKKIGIKERIQSDELLVRDLLNLMQSHKMDYTNTFVDLLLHKEKVNSISKDLSDWVKRWIDRLTSSKSSDEEVFELMKANNPCVIPRNYIVEEMILKGEAGDYKLILEMLELFKDPYLYSDKQLEFYSKKVPVNERYRTYCGT